VTVVYSPEVHHPTGQLPQVTPAMLPVAGYEAGAAASSLEGKSPEAI